MEAKNIVLLGFVNKALDYLGKHFDDKLDPSVMELKNIDLNGLKSELSDELNASLNNKDENTANLMNAGKEAFDKFMRMSKKEDLSNEFDRMFDVDLEDKDTPSSKNELEDLLAFYNLSDELNVSTYETNDAPEEEAKDTEAEEEPQFELNEEESQMLKTIAMNVNRKPEDEKEDMLSGANSQLDMIFSELMEAEEDIVKDEKIPVKQEEPKEEKGPVKVEVKVEPVDEKTKEALSQYIENPLIDLQNVQNEAEAETEEEKIEVSDTQQVDKDDIIKLIKEIQPLSDVYYNKIENFIDSQKNDLPQAVEEKPVEEKLEKDDRYVSSLIDDLKAKMSREEEIKKAEEEAYRQIYDKIHKTYPYLSNAFIRNVYELKESIARDYPLNEKIIVLHRSVFRDVEKLRQYVEIVLKHGYLMNADEKKMIVDVFKQYVNTDGKIITSIFEVANQSALLDGEYEGYRVLLEKDL